MSTHGDEPTQPTQPTNEPASEAVSFGPPSSEDPLTGTGTVLPATPPPAPRGKRRAVIAASVAAVVLVGGGAAAWAAASYLSGDGDQPAAVVPSSAIAYASVDLDPSAGQKIAAYRFLKKFPSSDQTSGEGDLMGQIVRSAIKSDSETKVDYDKDIKPWLGKRAAVAAVPASSGAEPEALVVVQVTDEAKAKTSIRKLLDDAAAAQKVEAARVQSWEDVGEDGEVVAGTTQSSADAVPTGLVVRNGWALIGENQAATQRMSDAAIQSNLADSSAYQDDMDKIGEKGVASAWVDVDAAKSTLDAATKSSLGIGGLGDVTSGGHVVAALRFDGSTVELTARQFGGPAQKPTTGTNGGAILAALPADTTGAVALGHASDVVTQAYESIDAEFKKSSGSSLADAGAEFGLVLPGDLQKLLGSGLAVVVGDVTGSEPQVAVRVVTKDAAGSKAVVEKVRTAISDQSGGTEAVPEVVNALSTDGIVYAITPTYAQLVAGAGTLGQQDAFKNALPDAAASQNAAYLNFAQVAKQVNDPEVTKNLAVLDALGLTTSSSGNESQMTIRLVAK